MRVVSSRLGPLGVIAAVLVATVAAGPGAVGTSQAQPAPDYARAKELYKSAELAMAESRFADAARDYGAAYEITNDPVLFYKIGSAQERAGKCDVALIYYRRYLRESKPSETFAALTRQRITACGGSPDNLEPGAGSAAAPGSAAGTGDSPPAGAGSATPPTTPPPIAAPDPTIEPAPPSPTPAPPTQALGRHRVAWMLVGGSIASVTVGAVLAYSANASESDLDDLYVGGPTGVPQFDARTKARYDDLVAEGERYQKLSVLSFGVAGALALGAAIKFLTDPDPEVAPDRAVRVTPTVSPHGGGVTAIVRF